MRQRSVVVALVVGALLLTTGRSAQAAAPPPLPNSIAALGDSISQAFDVCCFYGDYPEHSWTTGYAANDLVNSHYERVLAANPAIRGQYHDDAVTGATMGDTLAQAGSAVAQGAQYVTILAGANDVCTGSASTMTPTATFRAQFTATMQRLAGGLPAGSHVFVSSIPNVYALWSLLHGSFWVRLVWSAGNICQSMLSSSNSEATRQRVLAQEVADNTVLQQVCAQYAFCRWDNLAVFNYHFVKNQVTDLDWFHPSRLGQGALADVTWSQSWWPSTP